MNSKVLLFKPEKCIGCRLCEQWCSLHHYKVSNPNRSMIRIGKIHDEMKNFAIYCHQCKDTLCIDGCNYDALEFDKELGCIKIIEENCIGCKQCIESCPYGAPTFNNNSKKIMICDLCGSSPKCVEHCPEKAIIFIESEDRNELPENLNNSIAKMPKKNKKGEII